jgi:RNA-directed DNA polymerase
MGILSLVSRKQTKILQCIYGKKRIFGTAAEVPAGMTLFITRRLGLKANDKKNAVAQPQERKFLGFSFTEGPEVKRTIAPMAVERFKEWIREITRKVKSVSNDTFVDSA